MDAQETPMNQIPRKWSFGAQAGLFIPTDPDVRDDYGISFTPIVNIGHNFSKNYSLQVDASVWGKTVENNIDTFELNNTLSGWPLLVSAIYHYPFKNEHFSFYTGVGTGVVFGKKIAEKTYIDPHTYEIVTTTEKESKVGWDIHASTGLHYYITPHLDLNFGLTYSYQPVHPWDLNLGGVTVAVGINYQIKLTSHSKIVEGEDIEKLIISEIRPKSAYWGSTENISIIGSGFTPDMTISFLPPDGIKILSTELIDSSRLNVQISIDCFSPLDIRDLEIINESNSKYLLENQFEVCPNMISLNEDIEIKKKLLNSLHEKWRNLNEDDKSKKEIGKALEELGISSAAEAQIANWIYIYNPETGYIANPDILLNAKGAMEHKSKVIEILNEILKDETIDDELKKILITALEELSKLVQNESCLTKVLSDLANANVCGPDITQALKNTLNEIESNFNKMKITDKVTTCIGLINPNSAFDAWDIEQLKNDLHWLPDPPCCHPKEDCLPSVEVDNQCFHPSSVNYVAGGLMFNLCDCFYKEMKDNPLVKLGLLACPALTGFNFDTQSPFSQGVLVTMIQGYKGPFNSREAYIQKWDAIKRGDIKDFLFPQGAKNFIPSVMWALAGYNNWKGGEWGTPPGDRPKCAIDCSIPCLYKTFRVNWWPNGSFVEASLIE
jgi:opacity protein-like surface antigen/predicted DNA-binding ArsR family transcriptional regulator